MIHRTIIAGCGYFIMVIVTILFGTVLAEYDPIGKAAKKNEQYREGTMFYEGNHQYLMLTDQSAYYPITRSRTDFPEPGDLMVGYLTPSHDAFIPDHEITHTPRNLWDILFYAAIFLGTTTLVSRDPSIAYVNFFTHD